MTDDAFDVDLDFEASPNPSTKKPVAGGAKATAKAGAKPAAQSDGKAGEGRQMTAQERIEAMRSRLAGIRAGGEDEPKKKPAAGANRQLVRFSEAPGLGGGDDDSELYFDEDSFELPDAAAEKARPTPNPKPSTTVTRTDAAKGGKGGAAAAGAKKRGDEDEAGDDVPEIDTRLRSTMAMEKHWSEVEEKRKREEAQRKRKLKEKQAERANEEQRLLSEIQEKKRREEEARRRLAEEEVRRAAEDWKRKEDEKRKKFDAKMKQRDLQLQRLEEARRKREEQRKKLTDEEERRRREYEAEMTRLASEEADLSKKIAEEEEAKRAALEEEERRRAADAELRQKQEEERKRREAEEEMRLLEDEEKELLKREMEIERELEEKRRMREEKLRELNAVLQPKKTEQPPQPVDPEEMLQFVLQLNASARRIKGTVYHGAFTGSQGVDVLVQWASSRRDATAMGQRYLDAGLFWPVEGPMTLEDSERLYNLEDSHDTVVTARQELDVAAAPAPVVVASKAAAALPARGNGGGRSGTGGNANSAVPAAVVPPQAPAEPAAPVAELRVLDDAGQQLPRYDFTLFEGEAEIGRRSDNVISLPVLSVSKKHARLVCSRDGRLLLTDLGSSNKTRVFFPSNSAPVVLRPNEPVQLESGVEVLFGEIRCCITALVSEEYVAEFGDDDDGFATDAPSEAAPPPRGAKAVAKEGLDRFSVAPPMDAAPRPPGSALPPRSVVGPKRVGVRK